MEDAEISHWSYGPEPLAMGAKNFFRPNLLLSFFEQILKKKNFFLSFGPPLQKFWRKIKFFPKVVQNHFF